MYRSHRRAIRFGQVLGTAVAVAAIFSTDPAVAGRIEGRVTLSARGVQRAALNPYPGVAGSPTENATASSGAHEVVLYLKDFATPADAESARRELVQRDTKFYPSVIGIPVGGTVDFPNEDLVFHNVFSYSKTKKFDLGHYGRGKSKSVTFDKPGLVKVFCDIHSTMSAFIYVVDSAVVTQPNADGTYAIDVPAGNYTLVAWHPNSGEREFSVTVGNKPAKVNVDISL